MKLHIIGLVLLLSTSAYSQSVDEANYIPPSPNASTLMEYASVPVNLYSGIPEINIPLYNINSKVGDVPVSISYHASGNKVQEMASSIGLGWTLNAGGAITRLVRGLPDDDANGYLNIDFDVTTADVFDNEKDLEPDIFYYNFLGVTGRIVLDQNGNPLSIPENNLSITPPDFNSQNPHWVIVDKAGIVYKFGIASGEREQTSSKLEKDEDDMKKTYISSWYLSNVTSPDTNEIVNFSYLTGTNLLYKTYRQVKNTEIMDARQASCNPDCTLEYVPSATYDYNTEIEILNPKYIDEITAKIGKVEFDYKDDRVDINNALRLYQMKVSDFNDNHIKTINFNNNFYFSSCNTDLCKRLKIKNLQESTPTGSFVTTNSFEYNTTNLPALNSVKTDHWGYFNNNLHPDAIPTAIDNYQNVYPGADKSPDLGKTKAAVLEKIVHGTGGFTEFSYELNDFYSNNNNSLTGGLRISQIRESDGVNNELDIIRTYKYKTTSNFISTTTSSGLIYRDNVYDYEIKSYQYCDCENLINVQYGVSYLARFSSSLLDQFDITGRHVGYSEVKVEFNNGSSKIVKFTNFSDRPDDPAEFFSPQNSQAPVFLNPNGPPFIPRGDRSYERGLIDEEINLDQNNNVVGSFKNEYDFHEISNNKIAGVRIMLLWTIGNQLFNRKAIYYEPHRTVWLYKTTKKSYNQSDPGNESKAITTIIDYDYDPDHLQMIREATHTLAEPNRKYITEYRYPVDITEGFNQPGGESPTAKAIWDLKNNHVLTPLEITNKQLISGQEKITGVSINLYKKGFPSALQLTKPFQSFKLKLTGPLSENSYQSLSLANAGASVSLDPNLELIGSINDYDADGNPLQQTGKDGTVTTYEWGYNNSLLTASTINPSGANPLRTEYLHKPLVGVTQIKDPNGEKTKYSYDDFNRLYLIKDNDDKILKRYRYQYKEDNVELNANFDQSGINKINTSIKFTPEGNGGLFGVTKYIWDFGDGTVEEKTTDGYVNHSYSASGTYDIKFTVINPDYESVQYTQSLTIFDELLSPNLCVTGPIDIDICGIEEPNTILGCGYNIDTDNTIFNIDILTQPGASCGGPFTFQWKYKKTTSNGWTNFGNGGGMGVTFPAQVTGGTYEIKCEVKDSCNTIYTSNSESVSYYNSDQNCVPEPGDDVE